MMFRLRYYFILETRKYTQKSIIFLMVETLLMFCSIYGIPVFYDVPFVLIDNYIAFFLQNMLQCTLFFPFTVLYDVKKMLVYFLFTLGYA
jgi:hypothetical protein